MRRFRRGTAFGPVSQRERRNADLFLADLLGRGAPRGFLPHQGVNRFYEELVGEDAEDVEASTAPWINPVRYAEDPPDTGKPPTAPPGQPPAVTPGATSGQPTVKLTANKNEIIVTRADGTRFRLRRKIRAQVLTRPGALRGGFCSDDQRVFYRVSWCEGTQGTIDFGANVPAAFRDLMNKVVQQINQRAHPDDIKRTFENASVEAFLNLDIVKPGDVQIKGDIKLEINPGGIPSKTAKMSAVTPWATFGVEYTDGPDGKKVLVTADIPLSKRKIAGKECPQQELAIWWDVECLREVPTTITVGPPVPAITETETLYLYFDHAKTTFRRDAKGTAATPNDEVDAILRSDPKSGTARLNKRALDRLEYLVGQGYWVKSVDGYASPEGRRRKPEPTDKGAAAKWEGNDELSRERAQKVLDLFKVRYGELLRMRSSPSKPPVMKFPPGQRWPKGVGLSEKPKLNDRFGNELEGSALDRAILFGDPSQKIKPFLDENPAELTRMTAEDRQFITDSGKSPRNRAERLFENLRRVVICLRRIRPLKGVTRPDYELQTEHDCPNDLIEAAERHWGSRIPFTKPDPPLCG